MSIDRLDRKDGVAWRARVGLPAGKRVSRCFSRKVDAEKWEAEIISQGSSSTSLMRRQIRFHELATKFLEHTKAEAQLSTYQKYDAAIRLHLVPRFGNFWLEDISKLEVAEFRKDLLQIERSDSLKNFTFTTLKTLLRKGVEWELLAKSPAESVKPPKKGMARTEYWSEQEISQFLEMNRSKPRLPLYLFALNTGMRAGEIFGLKWDCIDFENGLVLVRRTLDQKTGEVKETTKTHKVRRIGISDALRALLQRLRSNSGSEFVLDRVSMGCKNASHVAREFASDCEKAGVRPINFHDLRHTYATQFVRRGGSIHALAGILGHSTTAMTSRYAHFGPEHAQMAAQVMSFDLKVSTRATELAVGDQGVIEWS